MFKDTWQQLKSNVPNHVTELGVILCPVDAAGMGEDSVKFQNKITKEIESHRQKGLVEQYKALPKEDRRRVAFFNRDRFTIISTSPSVDSQCSQLLFTSLVCLLFGAIDPMMREIQGNRIGNRGNKCDTYGDNLASAIVPSDRWRAAHDALKMFMFQDGRRIKINIQKEVYGLFTPYMDHGRRMMFENMAHDLKLTQAIVPDLVVRNSPFGSPLLAPVGMSQMIELKRKHSPTTSKSDGTNPLNKYYGRAHAEEIPRKGSGGRKVLSTK